MSNVTPKGQRVHSLAPASPEQKQREELTNRLGKGHAMLAVFWQSANELDSVWGECGATGS